MDVIRTEKMINCPPTISNNYSAFAPLDVLQLNIPLDKGLGLARMLAVSLLLAHLQKDQTMPTPTRGAILSNYPPGRRDGNSVAWETNKFSILPFQTGDGSV